MLLQQMKNHLKLVEFIVNELPIQRVIINKVKKIKVTVIKQDAFRYKLKLV